MKFFKKPLNITFPEYAQDLEDQRLLSDKNFRIPEEIIINSVHATRIYAQNGKGELGNININPDGLKKFTWDGLNIDIVSSGSIKMIKIKRQYYLGTIDYEPLTVISEIFLPLNDTNYTNLFYERIQND